MNEQVTFAWAAVSLATNTELRCRLDQRMQRWRDETRRRESRRGRDWIRVWKPGFKGRWKEACETREATENQVQVSAICYRRWREHFQKRKGGKQKKARWKGQNKQTQKNPQTWLTELIDGDELEGAGKQLLKKSAANNLPWVRCVKSISTASKAATVIGIPYWPVDGRQVGGRRYILLALVEGKHQLTAAAFIRFSHLAFPISSFYPCCSSLSSLFSPSLTPDIPVPAAFHPCLFSSPLTLSVSPQRCSCVEELWSKPCVFLLPWHYCKMEEAARSQTARRQTVVGGLIQVKSWECHGYL